MFDESFWVSAFGAAIAISEIFLAWRALVCCSNAERFGKNMARHIMLRCVAFICACKAAGWIMLNFHAALFLQILSTAIMIIIYFGYFDRLFHKLSCSIDNIFHLSVNNKDQGVK